jgi:glyoxylase-like metal-dependent hydrolase (beta-lactamase superfamily II)
MPTTQLDLPTPSDQATVDVPVTYRPIEVGDGITVIPSWLPVPGMGTLAANAFVLDGPEPVLVDAGPCGAGDGLRTAIESVIDPAALRWLWLTHTDPDHIGALAWLLDAAPDLTVVTTYLAVGKMGLHQPLPMDRLYWANPGEVLDVGGRRLVALRPPSFDAPETVGCFDATSGTLFSADTFGAVLAAPVEVAADIDPAALADGMVLWSTIDSPWLSEVDRQRFAQRRAAISDLGAVRVLSAHLPPAEGRTDELLGLLGEVPDADPWVGPDQAALQGILAQVQP